jgi:hypothetical protein
MDKIQHTYQISPLSIEVSFCEFVVSIDFSVFKNQEDLNFLYRSSGDLVVWIKQRYYEIFGKQLRITNPSFVAEIWGHLLVYRIAIWMEQNLKFRPLQKLMKFVAFRSGIVDCGERKADSNRWIWDLLGKLFFKKYNSVKS